ncbi:LPXTG cell wall anchor domain-containing protein [Streptococcus didelphis]|uniref:LPXTG cell wall anchor domain-containing protein n=1 Tax=Streptococcus didelphis TaxID=102886 RepID=A0ABY9LGC5_9STRE|nr:LPXTG cell wall anchor domain-containing protein [Streptococcus didelphis]WMB27947.1 LPXTG cell wall anchor domain-containing protein [Streptococcus didelphis]WMB29523.1 LPXTG cell wall anchor domain-containing protein [Streptococcus didelphis]WMB29586.1 LPXTG cell wall anchor domain-containing protein [Streptococcus didelphis]
MMQKMTPGQMTQAPSQMQVTNKTDRMAGTKNSAVNLPHAGEENKQSLSLLGLVTLAVTALVGLFKGLNKKKTL